MVNACQCLSCFVWIALDMFEPFKDCSHLTSFVTEMPASLRVFGIPQCGRESCFSGHMFRMIGLIWYCRYRLIHLFYWIHFILFHFHEPSQCFPVVCCDCERRQAFWRWHPSWGLRLVAPRHCEGFASTAAVVVFVVVVISVGGVIVRSKSQWKSQCILNGDHSHLP